jgi:starch synthase
MSTLESRIQSMTESFKTKDLVKSVASKTKRRRPRILLVTPELNSSEALSARGGAAPRAKAGGLADVCTMLVDSLTDRGADVHVTMPHFRNLFRSPVISRRLHLCEDREFFYRRSVYDGSADANRRAALVFQREVIQNVLPRVRPDIVHCHDWMTGLVPAAARSMGMKSLFTIHNLHDEQSTLAEIEDRGIDAARFWEHLHYDRYPSSYAESRDWNAVSFMPSAIHAADSVNTVSSSFLHEMMDGRHHAADKIRGVLQAKHGVGRAAGIVNAPAADCDPGTDMAIERRYDSTSHRSGKAANKLALQRACGLEEDADAPILFWPSRLDPVQKGCQLLADILYRVVADYMALGLQVVFVADGPFKQYFEQIADFHGLRHRIAVCGFNENLSRQAFAGSDFVLMPSAYEPCGLAQMVGLKYGSLPIVHNTGGLRDTVQHLPADQRKGNGFVFETHDSSGLRWAIDQAMQFYIRPAAERDGQIERIMRESRQIFSTDTAVKSYLDLYEQLAERSLFR